MKNLKFWMVLRINKGFGDYFYKKIRNYIE